ncbi:ABC transporter substrate-binding protein [Nocardioides humi]|uniref:ABC transporter substrate-binding protein n=1 Tax=Nocardioides humi TaxID=449461 RepID=A0ABN1ZVS8_9ACTN|nr:ABC transporter substrate-binding protein [Nocardioides humi]
MSTTIRKVAAALAAATLALGLAACGSESTDGQKTEDGLTKLTLQKYEGALLYTSDIIAQEQGFYEDNGLEVSFVNPGDGATSMQLLANGDTSGVIGDISGGLAAHSKGQPIVAVGSVINKNLFQISASKELLSVEGDWKAKMTALKGRTIAVPGIGGSASLTMTGLLESAGLDPEKDVTIVSVTTIPAAVSQLEQGTIDAFIYIPPAANVIENAGAGGLYLDIANDGPEEFQSALIAMLANQKWAEENPDSVEAWVQSQQDAIDWMRDPANREAVIDVIASNTTSDDRDLAGQLLDYLVDTAYSATPDGLPVDEEILQQQIDTQVKGGVVADGTLSADDMLVER